MLLKKFLINMLVFYSVSLNKINIKSFLDRFCLSKNKIHGIPTIDKRGQGLVWKQRDPG